MVRHRAKSTENDNEAASESITQNHRLIRSASDYGSFWKEHASRAEAPEISRVDLPRIWSSADWLKIIGVFNLEIEKSRRDKPDEIWIKSPFTSEKTASLHLNSNHNIFKDFSSGKGGGILNFCQDVLSMRGQSMNCYEVADWMVKNGISSQESRFPEIMRDEKKKKEDGQNVPIKADLCRWKLHEHPCLRERGISSSTCLYLRCGFLPERSGQSPGSPLNGRLVFQVRGIAWQSGVLKPVILSHVGRALTTEQKKNRGKYWSYPFFKGSEIYNQDNLLLDENARFQIKRHGLILVEDYFDVARLVEAGFLNAGALMGAYITENQIDRLELIDGQVHISYINLFLDRDEAGTSGSSRAVELLGNRGFAVRVFDWNECFEKSDGTTVNIPDTIDDAGAMSVQQLTWLRREGKL